LTLFAQLSKSINPRGVLGIVTDPFALMFISRKGNYFFRYLQSKCNYSL